MEEVSGARELEREDRLDMELEEVSLEVLREISEGAAEATRSGFRLIMLRRSSCKASDSCLRQAWNASSESKSSRRAGNRAPCARLLMHTLRSLNAAYPSVIRAVRCREGGERGNSLSQYTIVESQRHP